MRLLSRVGRTLRSPALLFMLLIVAVSFAGRALPSPWDDFVRRLNGFTLLYVILWLAFQARIHRNELRAHRHEILAMLNTRAGEIEELATESGRIAAVLAEETRTAAQVSLNKFDELGNQIAASTEASRAAEVAANHANDKIQHLNERLIEQGKANASGTEQQLDSIQQTATDSNEKLDSIQAVAEASHEMLKDKK